MAKNRSPYKGLPDFMTVEELAEYCSVTKMTIYRWRNAGKLQGYQTTARGKLYFKREDVEALFKPVDAK